MAYVGVQEDELQAINFDRAVKGIAIRKYKLKQVLMTPTSNSWQEVYYRETTKNLAALSTIPRLAQFPNDDVLWEKNTAYMSKHGLEAEISWEDAISNNIDVIQRVLLRIGSAVAQSVDTLIYDTLKGATGINSIAIAAGETWDNATRSARIPHEHIARAMALISDGDNTNYMPDTLLVNPGDWAYLLTNDFVLDSFDASAPNVMKNGMVGTLMGLNVIVTPAVSADEAIVLQSKVAGTWRSLQPLTTATKREEGIKYIIRAWEIGVPFVTDPEAICRLTNTRS